MVHSKKNSKLSEIVVMAIIEELKKKIIIFENYVPNTLIFQIN